MIALKSIVVDQIYITKKDKMIKMTSFWSKTYYHENDSGKLQTDKLLIINLKP